MQSSRSEHKSLFLQRQMALAFVFLAVAFGAWFYPFLGFFIPACMVLGIGLGFFKGRFWCGNFCPRGSFYDHLIKPLSPKKAIPSVFKSTPFRIIMMALLMGVMIFQLIRLWPDPQKIGRLFAVLLTVTTLVGIVLALIFHQRAWCSFCPVGTLANWLGRGKYLLKVDASKCVSCGLCAKACPMQLDPTIKDDDCLKCAACIEVCPVNALKL